MRCKTTATTTRRRRRTFCALTTTLSWWLSSNAGAQPLRLRGDAIAEAQSPAGLVVLQGEDSARPWMDVEGLVWAGAKPSLTGDVLVLAIRLREPHGYGEVRVGRFVLATGAILPVQIDGAEVVARAPWGSTVETFGGLPVVPRFGPRAYDWLTGGRIAQSIASRATLGLSYLQRREDGEISDEELGADFAAAPSRWLDVAARGAYDLTSPGIADALFSAATRVDDWRFEVFAADRSPSRLLPATSLFSVLGDFPSQSVGGTVKWRAAPRLDLLASGAGQDVGGALGGNGWLRATLRLDDRGDGNMGLELRREDVSTAQWTGVRALCAQPLGRGFRYSTELEIVVPDHPDGRGAAWPWGLMALSWRSRSAWEVAGALEASSTPLHRYETDALVRVAYVFGGQPSNPPARPRAGTR
ncbi:MAG TPA: hypothetical protein VGL81_24280 [Polyangiaceae bacterium]|jgi:hypothetical protein